MILTRHAPVVCCTALGFGRPNVMSQCLASCNACCAAQVKLAKRLVELSFADKAFFCNSGTEANEAAIKFARKYARVHGGAPFTSGPLCKLNCN